MVKTSRPLPVHVLQLAEDTMMRAKALGFRSGCQVRETGPGYRLVFRLEEPGELDARASDVRDVRDVRDLAEGE